MAGDRAGVASSARASYPRGGGWHDDHASARPRPRCGRRPGVAAGAAVQRPRAGARRHGHAASAWPCVPGDFEGATSRVLRAPRRFDLLGVRGPDAARGRFEVRVRRRGGTLEPVGGARRPRRPRARHRHRRARLRSGLGRRLRRAAAALLAAPARRAARALRRRPRRGPAVARRAGGGRPKQQAAPQPGTPPPIIPRAAWGADAVPPRSAPDYGVVQMAFVHHTVTANDYTPEQSASMVLGIAKYHRDTNGWNDIGYNFLVDQYGQVFEGRAGGVEQAVIGAHAQGYNSQSTGVAVLGTFTDVPIPEAAMAAITQLLGLEAVAARRALRGRADDRLGRRQPEPLPVRDAGGDAAHLRPPRRRQHRVPRRRPLRPAARAAPPRRGAGRADRRPRRR